MMKLRAALAAAAVALMVTASWAADKPVANTAITNTDAEAALKIVLPDVKVLSVEPAAINGLWEVAFKSRGDKGIVYLDSTKTHILAGSLIRIADGTNFTKKKFESINTVDFSSIPLEGSLVLGSKDAAFKVVVFDDPD